MASNTRKRVFPKPPVRFHSKLEDTLGKNSNKGGYDASLKAIYKAESKPKSELSEAEKRAIANIKRVMYGSR